MNRKTKILVAKSSIILAVPLILIAKPFGAQVGSAGVPGENTCAQLGCHVGTQPSEGGKVEISFSGDGQSYTPGAPQTLTVTITEPAARPTTLYGFQATTRKVGSLSEMAGGFAGGGGVRILCTTPQDFTREDEKRGSGCPENRPLEYATHEEARPGNSFAFTWTPPSENVGEVRIFVAANAANGNGQETGDRIYTANYTLTPQASGPRPTISAAETDGSFRPGIVAGSWTAIKGNNLAGTTRIWNAEQEIVNGRLPTSLDGVSVNINGKPAAVYYISPTQINVQAPADSALGPVLVEVIRAGQRSESMTANLQRALPGFFLFDPENRRYLAAVNSDGVFLGKPGLFQGLTTRPAAPGGTVLLFGTGFGPTTPEVPTGQVFSSAARLNDPVRITIGGIEATVPFAGLSGAGLYQFNVVVPANLPSGDHAVVAEIGGLRTQENAFITVQRNEINEQPQEPQLPYY